jgi:hypothetical protein
MVVGSKLCGLLATIFAISCHEFPQHFCQKNFDVTQTNLVAHTHVKLVSEITDELDTGTR